MIDEIREQQKNYEEDSVNLSILTVWVDISVPPSTVAWIFRRQRSSLFRGKD